MRRFVVAPAAVLVGVLALAACGTRGGSTAAPRTPTVLPTTTHPTTTPRATTTTPRPAAKATLAKASPTRSTRAAAPTPHLGLGDQGPSVLALQERLSALGYWLGAPNGVFGDATQQAVYALQKVAGLTRDGVVGPETQAALARRLRPTPRSTSGYVIEVDLQDDLVMFVRDDAVQHVLNTSTGGGYTYNTGAGSAVAITPQGHFQLSREVDGMVTDSLGQLWRPKYFYSGFAIHGDGFVPPYPASHGCVRVSNEAIDWIWADDIAPLGTDVWVY